MFGKMVLGSVLLLAALHAAASTKTEIAECAAKSSNAVRLICYDALAKRLGVDKPEVAHQPGSGEWHITTKTSPIDDSTNVYLQVNANTPVRSRFGSANRPSLVVRCAENETNVFITWGLYLGLDSTRMLTRFDKEKAQTKKWLISTDSKAVFVAASDIAFAKKMMQHDELLVQITPYGESPVMTTFNIRGLSSAIKPLRKACHW